ncbi:MAG: hypothetical protein M3N17_02775 [Actinomycetota bacterium]|nr:hypothetical protein [Actinomycetota bacterium]
MGEALVFGVLGSSALGSRSSWSIEAGQIEFRARVEGSAICFEIGSWARRGTGCRPACTDPARIAKKTQLHMWTHYCRRVGMLSGGRVRGGVHIHTRRFDDRAAG